MQVTMTRFSDQTLTANRNVDALRLRGYQGTPDTGTLVPIPTVSVPTYYKMSTKKKNRGCNWAPGVVRSEPFSFQRSRKKGSGLGGGVTRGWLVCM